MTTLSPYSVGTLFALNFTGHTVPILYRGDAQDFAALRPYEPDLYFTTPDCSGTARLSSYSMKDVGYGAFSVAGTVSSSLRIFKFSGARDVSSTSFQSNLNFGNCLSFSGSGTGYYILEDVTAQLPAVPATIPAGFRISSN